MDQPLVEDLPLHKREEPKAKNPSEDIPARIRGLELAMTYPEMSKADLAALDRSITKLKEKLAEKNASKAAQETQEHSH